MSSEDHFETLRLYKHLNRGGTPENYVPRLASWGGHVPSKGDAPSGNQSSSSTSGSSYSSQQGSAQGQHYQGATGGGAQRTGNAPSQRK